MIKKEPGIDKKKEAIKQAIAQIIKDYGQGAVFSLTEGPQKIKSISTGSMFLDMAIGVGGIPSGRITEVYGGEGSGKTTLSLHIVKNAQDMGKFCAFIDTEHALDVNYAKKIGINLDNLLISQPEHGEQALEIVDTLVKSGMDVIIVDSVAALVPKQEIEGEMGDVAMGAQARLMSQALRKLAGPVSKSDTAIVFINQTRSKIGVMFGNPETTTGGNALKFYSSLRIEVKRRGMIKKGDENIGHIMSARIAKNRLAPPYKEVEIEIRYGEGIHKNGEIIDMGVHMDLIGKSGAWYSYKDKKIGQGREAAIAYINEHDKIKEEIIEQINTIFAKGGKDNTFPKKRSSQD